MGEIESELAEKLAEQEATAADTNQALLREGSHMVPTVIGESPRRRCGG